jgi:hypothetical protein
VTKPAITHNIIKLSSQRFFIYCLLHRELKL